MQLPSPVMEQSPPGEQNQQPAEKAPTSAEKAGAQPPSVSAAASAAQAVPPPLPVSMPAVPAAQTGDATTTATNLQVTDDGDLIEKEWVNKAKQIVERTRDDPYKQSEELTYFKADYMKKRYGKTIKLSK
jgi:hypothetical protein